MRQIGHAGRVQPVATTKDLVQQAATAADGERPVLLARAEELADDAGDWQAVADAWATLGDVAAAERCLVKALQQSDHDIWDYRRAAATRVLLGDRAGALATLVTLEGAFLGRAKPNDLALDGLHWRLLAEGYAELQDFAGVRRCLDSGRERAVTADDLCRLARSYKDLNGDAGTARQLLERAEATAAEGVDRRRIPEVGARYPDERAWWNVADAWHEVFGDDARACSALAAGIAQATDVSGCLRLARSWSSYEEQPRQHLAAIRRCLDKARGFAGTCMEWHEIAEAARECDGDLDAVRSALSRAEALVTTSAERRRLALARRDWLGEADNGVLSEPVGLLPEELARRGMTASGWMKDAGALLEWLRPRMTEPMLTTIAEADGGYDLDEHLWALRGIVASGRVPVPLEWEPREVVSMSHWAEGLDVDHVQRAFCGTVLSLANLGPDPRGYDGIEDHLAILLESCAILGAEALVRAEGLLVALSESPECELRERAFAALGLLLAAVQRDPHDPRLETLAAHLLALDAELVRIGHYVHPEHGFVLGATCFDARCRTWKRLVQETFAGWHDDPARPALTEVVRRLLA